MRSRWLVVVCGSVLSLAACAFAQSSENQDSPVLKTRPKDSTAPNVGTASQSEAYNSTALAGPPNAIPEGTRFIIKLKDTLDTSSLEQGRRFKAELREDLVTPSGLIIPKGRTVKGHVGTFERGYTGARLLLAMDEIETRKGWVPLVATVLGVPGDPSIKSTGNEGEITRQGPDMKRAVTNAAIGAGVGAATGAMAGGSKGAAIGAIAGAGLGTGSGFLLKGRDLKLPKETQLEVKLDRDLTVPTH